MPYLKSSESLPFLIVLHLTSSEVPDTTRYLPLLLQLFSKRFQIQCYGQTQIYNPKAPPSQPSHIRIYPEVCPYSSIGSSFYLSIVVKLRELGLVEDWEDILGLVSRVLKVTINSSELYIISLGLTQIHTVWEGVTSFLPPTIFCPNELSPNKISGEGSSDELSRGKGSVVDCSIEPGRILALVLSVFLFISDIN